MKTIAAVKLEPGNIWSGSRTLAVFTAPTEIAFRKGNLKNHYPVKDYNEKEYPDAEALYQHMSKDHKANFRHLTEIMTGVLIGKFEQYPILLETIAISGGVDFFNKCCHKINGNKRWEGDGIDSWFIRCLRDAYVLCFI